jgi:hypothetical protein
LRQARSKTAMPVIGFFHLTSLETTRKNLASFRRGLAETGYVENNNVTIEYRWAEGLNDRLPTLAAEFGSSSGIRHCRTGEHKGCPRAKGGN